MPDSGSSRPKSMAVMPMSLAAGDALAANQIPEAYALNSQSLNSSDSQAPKTQDGNDVQGTAAQEPEAPDDQGRQNAGNQNGQEPSGIEAQSTSVQDEKIADVQDTTNDAEDESAVELASTGHDLYLKYLLVDAAAVSPGDTLDSIWTDTSKAQRCVLGQFPSTCDLLDPGEAYDFYIGLMDTTRLTGASKVMDAVFAMPNNDGELVDGCSFDYESGIAYIPKHLYDNGAFALQAQVMLAYDFATAPKVPIDVVIGSEGSGLTCEPSQCIYADALDVTTTIPVMSPASAGSIGISNLTVFINGSNYEFEMTEGENAVYDPTTGELTLAISALNVFSIEVIVHAPGIASLLTNYAYAAPDPSALMAFPSTCFENLNVDTLTPGRWIQYETSVIYVYPNRVASDHSGEVAEYCRPYCYGYTYDPESLYDMLAYSEATYDSIGDINSSLNCAYFTCIFKTPMGMIEDQDFSTNSWPVTSAFDTEDGCVGWSTWLGLQCSHVANPIAKAQTATSSIIGMRILKVDTDAAEPYMIVGFVGPEIATQAGSGIYKFRISPNIDIELLKESANKHISDSNAQYGLGGAVYGVYNDEACTDAVATIQTDGTGYGVAKGIRKGTYYVKEISPSTGYALDETVYPVSGDNGTVRVNGSTVPEVPMSANLFLTMEKHDAETGYLQENLPLGSASFEGAEYKVTHYDGLFDNADDAVNNGDAKRSWTFKTDASGRIDLSKADEHLVEGDLYRDLDGHSTFPLGTYVFEEVKAPEGYELSSEKLCAKAMQDGSSVQVSSSNNVRMSDEGLKLGSAEQVSRGDIKFVKVREDDMSRLVNVPFALTSETTGETHVVVTDKNGRIDTSSEWIAHTKNTNANDWALDVEGCIDAGKLDSDAGVWFGQTRNGDFTQANDSLGALPYDTYSLQELPCTSNKGLDLVSVGHIEVKRNNTAFDLGTVTDAPIDEITETTTTPSEKVSDEQPQEKSSGSSWSKTGGSFGMLFAAGGMLAAAACVAIVLAIRNRQKA